MILYYKISLAFHVLLSLGLLIFIILQKGSSAGLFVTTQSAAFGSGKQLNDFVNKTISFMLILFLVNSLILARINIVINNHLTKSNISSPVDNTEESKTNNFNPEDFLL
jgi:protein translocase SecG subunit